MLKVVNIILPIDYSEADLKSALCERLRTDKIKEIILDQRELVKGDMHFKITALCSLDQADEDKAALILRKKGVSKFSDGEYIIKKSQLRKRPVVVGFGPAGIFAALVLAESGAKPIIIERGAETEKRIRQVIDIPAEAKIKLVIAVGHTDETEPRTKKRKELNEVYTFVE